ncbi:NAD-dependent epimerase/dehydratase family protein [Agrococcus sp. KRD186]|jgi:nucleoside-diphosphate-sugar epimerase|uniref:NAD-dependent epimerase/dehydratase family protein n=1 Tax=Agrococcus sp. KRD186 TaxID=2729730 RepID=UPI0019D0D56F|nr:NAD-dependent epimerase/dehydratase family protein [Agrococcus sp. KRD186]
MTRERTLGRVLVLGGTRWLGRRIAQAHLARGADVTCLARGEGGDASEGARLVVGDRERADAYAGLTGEWDEVVDVTRLPAHAAGALDALADRARHWTFVSSVSAQRLEGAPVGAAEDDELVPEDVSGEEYGGAKAWIERVARERLGERLAIVRPGLIGGPGDESGRFGYWVARLALAGGDPVLVPARDQPTQTIDVRDLVDFLVEQAPTHSDIVNAVGAAGGLHDHIALAREIAGHTGELARASDEQLAALGIEHWAGPRALPLTLPAELGPHAQRSSDRYRAAGGTHRPLRETLEAVLADERALGLDRPAPHRLSRADELAAIDSLASLS